MGAESAARTARGFFIAAWAAFALLGLGMFVAIGWGIGSDGDPDIAIVYFLTAPLVALAGLAFGIVAWVLVHRHRIREKFLNPVVVAFVTIGLGLVTFVVVLFVVALLIS